MSDKLREALQAFIAIHTDDEAFSLNDLRKAIRDGREALAADDAARGTMREAFEAFCPYKGSPDPWVVWQACWQAATRAAALPCGHPASLMLHSAETGEPLYCELCDDKSGRADAECRESELSVANESLRQELAALKAAAPQSVEPVAGAVWNGKEVMLVRLGEEDSYLRKGCSRLHLTPPSAPTDAEWQELHDALANSRRRYGEVGTRDVDIADWNARVDRALAALRAHLSTRPQQATEVDRLDAAPMKREVLQAIQLAYGYLWHINNEPAAPVPIYAAETAAYQARKYLRDLLTTEKRGEGINQVGVLIGRYDAAMSARPSRTEGDRLDAERDALLEEARDALRCMQWSAVSNPSCQLGAVKRCSCRRCAGAFARAVLEKLDAAMSAQAGGKEQGS